MSFSVAAMMLCVYLAGLPWLRRPEAWMAALLAQLVALPEMMLRLDQGRPFLVSEGVLICILFAWGRERTRRPSWQKLVLTTVGLRPFRLGAWRVVFVGVRAGRLFDGRSLARNALAGGVLGGSVCWRGAAYRESRWRFCTGRSIWPRRFSSEHAPKWMLVGEFQPSDGEFCTLTVLALVYLWRRQQSRERISQRNSEPCAPEPARASSPSPPQTCGGEGRGEEDSGRSMQTASLLRQPVFWMIAIFWALGFVGDRFWADWGMTAATVWLAMQIDSWMAAKWPADGGRRLLLCGLLAVPLYLDATSDLHARYTQNQQESVLDASNPDLQGWLPEGDGIFYSADMAFFYNTFYKNPQGNWRYILGFEPALMPEEDLKILRNMAMEPL